MTSSTLRPARRRCPTARSGLGVAWALALLLAACGDDSSTDAATGVAGGDAAAGDPIDTGDNPDGCIEGVDGDEDVFADQYEVRYAENFRLEYHGSYKVLSVSEPYPGAPEATYVLVQCGTGVPELEGDLDGATVVTVPVETLHSQSTSHLGFLDELGAAGTVTGVGSPDAVVLPSVRDGIDNGDVLGVAPEDVDVAVWDLRPVLPAPSRRLAPR
jgi:iron complex transport system substrate-binding protein